MEPEIIINGVKMAPKCAATLELALRSFSRELLESTLNMDEDALNLIQVHLDRIFDLFSAIRKSDEN